jgi:hypothetical protein
MQSAAEGEPSEESSAAESAESANTVSDLSTVIHIRGYLRHSNLGQHVSLTRRRQCRLAEFQIKGDHLSTWARNWEVWYSYQLPRDVYTFWLLATCHSNEMIKKENGMRREEKKIKELAERRSSRHCHHQKFCLCLQCYNVWLCPILHVCTASTPVRIVYLIIFYTPDTL